ncbi:MAG: ATP-binding protein [Ruminiclostridium sp.]|nr:ATP-binding protein [Ruminiclostridium sp.]
MALKEEFFTAADNELRKRRQKNHLTAQMRLEEIRVKHPEIYSINFNISQTTAKFLRILAERKSDISAKIEELKNENLSLQEQLRIELKKHGYPADYLDPIYDCKVCEDTGIVDGHRCKCFMDVVKKAATDDMNRHSPLKLCRFEDFSLSYYDDTTVTELGGTARKIMEYNYNICRRYAEEFHLPYSGLLLRGKTGLGKTHLSLSIASAVIEKGYSVIYNSAPDMFRRIEREHFNRSSDSSDTLSMVISTDLLVIDDLGTEIESKQKFCMQTLYNIINDRLNASRPTIISTNLDHNELEQRYEERTYSRLTTMEELIFVGSDVRFQKAISQ